MLLVRWVLVHLPAYAPIARMHSSRSGIAFVHFSRGLSNRRQLTSRDTQNAADISGHNPKTGVKHQTAGRPGRSEANVVFIAAASQFILNRVRKHSRTCKVIQRLPSK
jgi:hypothetical protein